jgi:hypothetical protein
MFGESLEMLADKAFPELEVAAIEFIVVTQFHGPQLSSVSAD